MASPKSGSAIDADAPKDPAQPKEAISTDPGELSKIQQANSQIPQTKVDSASVDPTSPPPSGGGDNPPPLSWISVELQDNDGKAIVGEPFYILFSDNSRSDDVTGKDGKCKIEGVTAGSAKIDFHRIDKREWKPK